MTQSPQLDFTGKVLHVYARAGSLDSQSVSQFGVSSPEFRELAGRWFLVGETIDFQDVPIWKHARVWHLGASICIAWDCVSGFLVFESIAAYKAAYAVYTEQQTVKHEAQAPTGGSFWPFRRT